MKVKDVLDQPIDPSEIRRLLKKGPTTLEALAKLLGSSTKNVYSAITDMAKTGSMIYEHVRNGETYYDLKDGIHLEPGNLELQGSNDFWTFKFGFVTDKHLCNKHSRLDVQEAAYKHFHSEGITIAFDAGNPIDGEAKFNKTELVTAPGMDNQVDYWIDKHPCYPDITTYFVAGDDHEGWYQQREGIEIGRYMEMRAKDQGRDDLKYLGYAEADVRLTYGEGSSAMRVVHPGGGSSYAISYTDQKRVESYQGGDKPRIELAGHYHKFNYGYPREVYTVQGGCAEDQTLFMRKRKLQAMVGYSIIKIKLDDRGIVTRFVVEWVPFYDRKFYENRF